MLFLPLGGAYFWATILWWLFVNHAYRYCLAMSCNNGSNNKNDNNKSTGITIIIIITVLI